MRVAIILNGISLAKARFYKKILPLLTKNFTCDVFETRTRNDAVSLASKAASKRYDFILAAGGDGTVHQVINGMLRDHEAPAKLPVLGVIPLGGGNDFWRALPGNGKPDQLIRSIAQRDVQTIDIGEILYSGSNDPDEQPSPESRYFINVADAGMGPEVVSKVLASGRAFGSAFSYYKSIITTFFTYRPVIVHAVTEDWEWHGPMRTFAVANGKYYGNGLCIAPDARLDDRTFNVFACGDVSVLDFIRHSIPLRKGQVVRHPKVNYHTCKEIRLSADRPVMIEGDGEILGWLPATVRFAGFRMEVLRG